MQITIKQLNTQLTQSLSPAYLISGDEPLQLMETRTKVIDAAKKKGFLEHVIHHIESGFRWEMIQSDLQNRNLFFDKKIVDIRNFSTKFDTVALELLTNYFSSNNTECVLLITTGKLTSAHQKTQWFQLFKTKGTYVPIWPVDSTSLPQWIRERAAMKQITLSLEQAKWLANYAEGNLLAAQQSIEKLALLYPQESITFEKLQAVTTDQGRFTVFDLANCALMGEVDKSIRILSYLKQVDIEPTLMVWALTKELRELSTIKTQIDQGQSMQLALSRVWVSKKPLVQRALSRHTQTSLYRSITLAAQTDEIIKGAMIGDSWQALCQLTLSLCGVNNDQ